MTSGTSALMQGTLGARSQARICIRPSLYDNSLLSKEQCRQRIHSSSRKLDNESIDGKARQTRASPSLREKIADRDLFLSILSSTSTKREARSYLSKFSPSESSPPSHRQVQLDGVRSAQSPAYREVSLAKKYGINLGSLYMPIRAVEGSPVFSQYSDTETIVQHHTEPLHVALVKIRAPDTLDDSTLEGVCLTLSQLGRLGLSTVVVTDHSSSSENPTKAGATKDWRHSAEKQADRVVAAIGKHQGPGARRLDNLIGISSAIDQSSSTASVRRAVHVAYRDLLLAPLRRGITPVIAPVGYTTGTQQAAPVNANDVVLALAREFAGILAAPLPDEDPLLLRLRIAEHQKQATLERLIILDPLGGTPGRDSSSRSHVFINMEQEFDDIRSDLLYVQSHGDREEPLPEGQEKSEPRVSDLARGNPFSSFAEAQAVKVPPAWQEGPFGKPTEATADLRLHLENLELLQRTLALLPPSSSALLTTPDEAANAGRSSHGAFVAADVGTRRQKNPLIHNLLTDKPLFSSSLPSGRLGPSPTAQQSEPFTRDAVTPTTFVKRGMPLTILPDPRGAPWMPPKPGEATLSLSDPRIDLPRLIHLIEDSFNRKLDVEHYLSRINGRIAGVIIAGEYEGGALLTWETPPESDSSGPQNLDRTVPYLDKFAVLKRSQGAGGVADILFNAMVRTCLPAGVCWRSRRDNPVNKWYFERARGTWKIPDSNWTMFWTTEGMALGDGGATFRDYEGVCREVVPSWADRKRAAD